MMTIMIIIIIIIVRYGGTVGVRNPRLVAQMRGVPASHQQQHIQMNMMAARGW